MQNKASFVAIAWPETLVIQEGKWYDTPMKWLGLIKNGYYQAGHAAFVLVNHEKNVFEYYDFGRYHTPFKQGRVRSAQTDPELTIRTKPMISDDKIVNLEEMLVELQSNDACHGDGKLFASILYDIDLQKAENFIKKLQDLDSLPYGPLKMGGTNCSRFVCQTARKATRNPVIKVLLALPYTFSATPMFNVRVINSTSRIHVVQGENMNSIGRLIINWSKNL
ncbi:MAG: hypothetical protein NWQ38_06615 [Cellulophaga sp.]|nr:hypothetical protein [Cellulophaga sp.]